MNTNDWRQSGKVYIWRYKGNPRNYPGWHMTADKDGCRSLIELLNSLNLSTVDGKRTVKLTKPTAEQYDVAGCHSKPIPAEKMIIIKSDDENAWALKEVNAKIEIVVGYVFIELLIKELHDILSHDGDYSIGKDSEELWFWW